MGNTGSNANRAAPTPRTEHSSSPSTGRRDPSESPGPGHPHRSLRTKKKSLELPDFVSLTLSPSTLSARGRQKPHQPATAIPIPAPPNARNPFSHYNEVRGIQPQRQRPRNNFSSTVSVTQHLHDEFDDVEPLQSPSRPFPPPSRAQQRDQQQRQQQQQPPGSRHRGRQPPMSPRQITQMQELYDNSLDPHPAAPPSSPAVVSRPREVVRSSIPVVLGAATIQPETQESNLLSPIQEDLSADPVPVTIVWKAGGTNVILSRAGDDDWKGRQPMERESPDSNTWTATVYLRPGTHHVRFLVDGQWRVADDLPAAVDDQGSLANYIAVYGLSPPPQLASSPPPPPPPPARKVVPGQSFWSATSADGDNDADDTSHPPLPKAFKHPQNAAAMAYVQARWTNILPLELIEAQKEEEVYLAASAGQFEAQQQQQASSGRVVVTGFIPAPNIPAAPGLPRHLDKLILNSKVGEKTVGPDRAGTPGSQGSGVGSGQGGGRRRDRENRERERERDRDRERERDRDRERERERDREKDRDRAGRSRRPNLPPPPPPSEDGSGELDIESTYVPMNRNNGNATGAPTSLKNQTDSSASSATGMSITTTLAASTAATTPHVSVAGTPSVSPTQSARKLAGPGIEGQGQQLQPLVVPMAGSSTLKPPMDRAPNSGSRIITIDSSNMPGFTDDASVLPVPSHVVLHHLCTSAIKNGVLAVANTTRYRKKYLTTIYYKPT